MLLLGKIKYHGLNGNAIVRGSYAYIPVSSLAEIFHMRLKTEENGRVAYLCGAPQIGKIISEEVEEIQFAEGNIACIVNNSVESMYAEAVMKENELCVSLEWFARRFLRLSVSECDGVVYATDHPSRISWHMADLIHISYIGGDHGIKSYYILFKIDGNGNGDRRDHPGK